MNTFARLQNNVVIEVFSTEATSLDGIFSHAVATLFIPCTANVQQGWIFANDTFSSPPAPPEPTAAQQAAALLVAGCQIQSTAAPGAINGTYPTDPASQAHVTAEITSLLLNGNFADGEATVVWQDVEGHPHTFDVPQYKSLATALAAFVAGCLKVLSGQSQTLPVQPSVIP